MLAPLEKTALQHCDGPSQQVYLPMIPYLARFADSRVRELVTDLVRSYFFNWAGEDFLTGKVGCDFAKRLSLSANRYGIP